MTVFSLLVSHSQTLREAMSLPSENKMAAIYVVQIHTHARLRIVKNGRLARSRTNRKRSSFATKHFQRKSLKIFDLHPPLRRLVSFVARIIAWKVRCWVTDTHTDTQTHRPSTVTLAAHARRVYFAICVCPVICCCSYSAYPLGQSDNTFDLNKLSYVHDNTLNNNRLWANPQNIGTAYTNYWYTTKYCYKTRYM